MTATATQPQVMLIHNPFNVQERGSVERFVTVEGITIREWVDQNLGVGWVSWDLPTLCFYNGKKHARAEWETTVIKDGDVIAFSVIPGDVATIVIAIVAVVVAVVAAIVMMPDPVHPEDGKQGDSVFTWKGQDNRLRIGEPIECVYGRCRIWGSYAAPPYNVYVNNEAITHVLLCLSQGELDIEADQFYLEDTPTENFEDVAVEVIPPGGTITLFKSNVVTSAEVSGLELMGSNQPDFPVSGWYGPFIVNPAGSLITRIEVDIVFPQGMYQMQDNLRYGISVGYSFEYQEIDEEGDPVGAWTDLSTGTIARRSATPQRVTVGANIVAGRYQVRGKRTTVKDLGTSVVSTMQWESLKGYSSNSADYGNVTLVAFVAKATNNLNAQTRSRINCFATRKLPIWDPETETWSAPTATRNPIWAFCDVFRATYGAQLADTYLDLPTLATLAEIAETREDWFDFTFDQRQSVWSAAQLILRVMRSVPIPQGSLVTAVRDQERTLPAAIFTTRNIVKGTLTKKLAMFEFQAKTAIRMEYTDSVTWKPEEVLCTIDGVDDSFVLDMKLPGCTQREQAFHEGMYVLAGRVYRRQVMTFETGMEGYIPSFMDLVAIQHPLVRYGAGGYTVAYDEDTLVATLSTDVTFEEGEDHYIAFRGEDGAMLGEPILVTAGSKANQVVLATPPEEELDFSINQTPPLFVFGKLDQWAFLGNVAKVAPKGNDRVELTVNIYDARVFSFDEDEPPALTLAEVIRDPGAPTVTNLLIGTRPDNINSFVVSWAPAQGAFRYIIDRSYDDGGTWERVAEVGPNITSYEFTGLPGEIRVRVAVVGQLGGRGQWVQSSLEDLGSTGDIPIEPDLEPVQPSPTDTVMETRWLPSVGATGYTVEVWEDGGTMIRRDAVNVNLKYQYTMDMLKLDRAANDRVRDFEFRIMATGWGASSDVTYRYATNTKPAGLTGLAATHLGGGIYRFSWDPLAVIPGDFLGYRLYVSNSSGIPLEANLVYEGTTAHFDMPVSVDKYWWVAAFDEYAISHTDANFGSQQFLDV